MATVYSDRGHGVRAPVVFYNRCNEAAALLKPGDFDWKAIFGGGRALVPQRRHLRGALRHDRQLIIEGMQAAKAAGRGHLVRPELPREAVEASPAAHDRALEVLQRIVEHVDVLVGNEEDLQKGLGIAGPDVAAKSKLDPSAFFGMIDTRRRAAIPHIKVVATTLREVHSTNRHSWSAVAWIERPDATSRRPASSTSTTASAAATASPSGLFYGLLTGETPEEAVKLGWAHGALLTTFPATRRWRPLEQVRAFAKGGSARIQR